MCNLTVIICTLVVLRIISAQRVTRGLVALYEFTEGLDDPLTSTVIDRSGLQLLGNITLDLSRGISWHRGEVGVHFSGKGALSRATSLRSSALLKTMWANEARGFTMEMWALTDPGNDGSSGSSSSGNAHRTPVLGFGNYTIVHDALIGCDLNAPDALAILYDGAFRNFEGHIKTTGSRWCVMSGLPTTSYPSHVTLRYDPRVGTGPAWVYVNVDGYQSAKLRAPLRINDLVESKLRLAPAVTSSRGTASAWQGAIYMVAVYDRSLSDAEVTQNFGAGIANGPPILPTRLFSGTRVFEETMTNITLYAVDPNGDEVMFIVTQGPNHGTLYSHDGQRHVAIVSYPATLSSNYVQYMGEKDFESPPVDSFVYRASDGVLSSATKQLTINVIGVNDPPLAVNSTTDVYAGTFSKVHLVGIDNDGPIIGSVTIFGVVQTLPSDGTLHVSRRNATGQVGDRIISVPWRVNVTSSGHVLVFYEPKKQSPTMNGEDMLYLRHFTYRISDSLGALSPNCGTMQLQVRNVLQAPNATLTVAYTTGLFSLPVQDHADLAYTVTITALPSKGRLHAGNQTAIPIREVPYEVASSGSNLFVYIPNEEYAGVLADSMQYFISRDGLQSALSVLEMHTLAADAVPTLTISGGFRLLAGLTFTSIGVPVRIRDVDAAQTLMCVNAFMNEQTGVRIRLATLLDVHIVAASARRLQIRGTLAALSRALDPLEVVPMLAGNFTLRAGVFASDCGAVSPFAYQDEVIIRVAPNPDTGFSSASAFAKYVYIGLAALVFLFFLACKTCCWCCDKYATMTINGNHNQWQNNEPKSARATNENDFCVLTTQVLSLEDCH